MNPSKKTHKRLKSTSPNKNRNRYAIHNSKKKESILAIEETKKLYTKLFSNPNNIIINQLKGDYIKVFINSFQPKDIQILSVIISKYFYFNSIQLGSFDPEKGEEDKKQKKKDKYIYQNEKERKSMENEKILATNKILMNIGKNLYSSKKIFDLSLFGFNLDKKIAENISQGITKNKTLQTLIIKNCKIPIDVYEILLKGILSHEKIKLLDLSDNNFNDKYGNMIARIITRQGQRRDQIIWSYGLRNEFPSSNDYARGLISINLHGNKLGEKSTDKICYSLCSDNYIRAIDLSGNLIDTNSCKKFIYMMRKNNTLLTIDLRNNPGYDENIHSRLVMKMSKNIHFLYQQFQNGSYTEEEFENLKDYIEISFFDVDIPQEIVEFYNQNLPEEAEEEEEGLQGEEEEMFQSPNFEEEEEKAMMKPSNNINNNYNNNNNNYLNKSRSSEADRSLIEENMKLKQQIVELKALNLQRQLKNKNYEVDMGNQELDQEEDKNSRTIEGDYKRVLELINELNEVMNDIENKKKKKESKNTNKKPKNINKNEINDNIDINNNINDDFVEIDNNKNNISDNKKQSSSKKKKKEKVEKGKGKEKENKKN